MAESQFTNVASDLMLRMNPVATGAILAGAGVITTSAMVMAAAEAGIMTGAAIDAAVVNRCGQ